MGKVKPAVSRVVEAIVQLRKQRSAPDFVQIAGYLEKQYGMKAEVVRVEVDKLIDENVISLIEYKGDMIYTVAAASNSKKSVVVGIGSGANSEDLIRADDVEEDGISVTDGVTDGSLTSGAGPSFAGRRGSRLSRSSSVDRQKTKLGQSDLISDQSNSQSSDISTAGSGTVLPVTKPLIESARRDQLMGSRSADRESLGADLGSRSADLGSIGADDSSTDEEGVFEKGGIDDNDDDDDDDDDDEDSSSEQVENRLIERSLPSTETSHGSAFVSRDSISRSSSSQSNPEPLAESRVMRKTETNVDGDEAIGSLAAENKNTAAPLGCESMVAGVMLSGTGRGGIKRNKSFSGGKKKKSKKSHTTEHDATTYTTLKRSRCDSDANSTGSKGSTSTRGSTSAASGGVAKCDFCQQTSQRNRLGVKEDLLICKDCDAKAHPSCMDYSEELAARAARSPWQCMECKTCNVCYDSGDADAMLFCDSCDKGFHMNCHRPAILDKPKGKWVCCKCILEQSSMHSEDSTSVGDKTEENLKQEAATDVNKNLIISDLDVGEKSSSVLTVTLPTPTASPVQAQFSSSSASAEASSKLTSQKALNGGTTTAAGISAPTETNGLLTVSNGGEFPFCPRLPRLSTTLIGAVPDASGWSPTEVGRYFHDLGFTLQSRTFIDQEIDGRALLLLTRSDVLTGLSLKLGPALKIYAHIQRLQSWSGSL